MYIIGIAGGSGSGKTSVVKKIINSFSDKSVRVLPQDAYYKDNGILTQDQREKNNFDHPDSIEFSLLRKHISGLTTGNIIEMPTYSYITCTRQKATITITPGKVIVVEGILIFTDPELRDMLDLKVFVDTEADERIIRIIQRDVNERGRGLDKSIQHYKKFVKPMHEIFIEPSKKYADIIIPEGGHNTKGIDILISKIKLMLNEV
jgi:uridine kinase